MIILYLLAGHALADYPLQGDFISKGKCRRSAFPGIPWQWILFWHAMIHAGFVGLITGYVGLGIIELILHMIIDILKCEGKTSFNTDQLAHVVCKFAYVVWMLR